MKKETSIQLHKQKMSDKIATFKSILIKNQWADKDKKTFNMLLQKLISQLEKTNLYNEKKDVYSEYEELNHAIDSIYTYLYDQKNSNLNIKDVKVFASYLANKIKAFKSIIENIDKQ
jgi:IS1 family transposase